MQEPTAQPGTDIATLPPADRAVIVLNSTKAEKELRALVAQSAGIVTVIDAAGREEAHRAAMNLKNARIAIEKTGKAARDDANKFSAAVIAEEKRLVAIVAPEEARVFGERDKYDAKVRAEREEAERIERERVAGIKTKIAGILNLPAASFHDTSAALKATLDELAAFEITEADFAELAGEAAEAKATALGGLRDLLTRAKAAEAEQKRLEEERAELQRIQAEAIERQRAAEAEAARVAAEQAETQRKLDAALAELAQHRAAAEQPRMWSPEPAPADQFAEMVRDVFNLPGTNQPAPMPAEDDGMTECGEPEVAYENAIAAEEAAPGSIIAATDADGGVALAPSAEVVLNEVMPLFDLLYAAVLKLRNEGVSNEAILVAVGEALEAIDAKEAA